MDGYAKEWIISPTDREMNGIINKYESEIDKESCIVEIRKLEKQRNRELIVAVKKLISAEDKQD